MKAPHLLHLLVALILLSIGKLHAQELIELTDQHLRNEIGPRVLILEDPSRKLTFEDIASGKYNDQFKKGKNTILNFGYSTDDVWLRFDIIDKATDPARQWLIEAGYPTLELVEIFFVQADGSVIHKQSGYNIPHDQRDVRDRSMLFRVPESNSVQKVYLHASGYDKKYFRINVLERDEFFINIKSDDILLAFYYGLLFALIAYNLFLYLSTLDTSYILYVGYVFFTGLTQMLMTTFAMGYLGENFLINHYSVPVTTGLAFAFGLLFSFRFNNVVSFFPGLRTPMIVALILIAILTVLQYIPGLYSLASNAVSMLEIILAVSLYVTAIRTVQKGYRPSRYYLLAWTFLVIGINIMLLKHMGILSVTIVTQHAMKFCVSFEAIVLSMGLADRMNTMKLQLKMKTLESERLSESQKMKADFLTNISHELRTPLSLIISPLEKIMKEKKNGQQEMFHIMHRNAKRLLKLVNQLLDLAKLDSKSIKLKLRKGNVIDDIRLISSYFKSAASERGIRFDVNFHEQKVDATFDHQVLETILSNLLSNALKFTPAAGTVVLDVLHDNDHIKITVRDNGVGIPVNQHEKIFDRFYQVNSLNTREHEGTGIGLSLVKELVEHLHGTINVASSPGAGATFIVRLPIDMSYFANDGFEWENIATEETTALKAVHGNGKQSEENELHSQQRPTILLVEDNDDFRTFTKTIFINDYDVIEASNGAEGWEKVTTHQPELVISDLMMPKMDGNELCTLIKGDIRTSHIPVILLTARQSAESRLLGLTTGADDYISKPFNADELLVRAQNLIHQRERLREVYQKDLWKQPRATAMLSANEKFLSMITTLIEEHISSGELNVTQLGKEAGMSRTQIFKKLKALTGQSPSDFIRTYKLNKAVQFLTAGSYPSIADVAYSSGFNSPSHFTEIFGKQFGMSPTDFIAQVGEKKA